MLLCFGTLGFQNQNMLINKIYGNDFHCLARLWFSLVWYTWMQNLLQSVNFSVWTRAIWSCTAMQTVSARQWFSPFWLSISFLAVLKFWPGFDSDEAWQCSPLSSSNRATFLTPGKHCTTGKETTTKGVNWCWLHSWSNILWFTQIRGENLEPRTQKVSMTNSLKWFLWWWLWCETNMHPTPRQTASINTDAQHRDRRSA